MASVLNNADWTPPSAVLNVANWAITLVGKKGADFDDELILLSDASHAVGRGAEVVVYRGRWLDNGIVRRVAVRFFIPKDSRWPLQHFLDASKLQTELSKSKAGLKKTFGLVELSAEATGSPLWPKYAEITEYTTNTLADILFILDELRVQLSVETVSKLIGDLLDGVEALHEAGFIHRDIKLVNLFVSIFGERPVREGTDLVNSNLSLGDFGAMVKSGTRVSFVDQDFTTAFALAKDAWKPPEHYVKNGRLRADPYIVLPSTDIYAVGVILGDLLKRCSKEARGFKALDQLQKRCIEADPTRRPPITEIRSTLTKANSHPVHRHRWTLVLTLVIMLLTGILAWQLLQPYFTTMTATVAQAQLSKDWSPKRAVVNKQNTFQTLDHLRSDQIPIELLQIAGDLDASKAPQQLVAMVGVDNRFGRKPLPTEFGHTDACTALAISPDGRFLYSGGLDQKVLTWDLSTNPPAPAEQVLLAPCAVVALSASKDGSYLAYGCFDGTVVVYDLIQKKELLSRQCFSKICKVVFNHSTTLLAVGSDDDELRLLSLTGGKDGQANNKNRTATSGIAFSSNDKFVIAGSTGQLTVFDCATMDVVYTELGKKTWYAALSISEDGQYLAANGLGVVAGLIDLSLRGLGNNNDKVGPVSFGVREVNKKLKPIVLLDHEDRVYRSGFDETGHRLVTVTQRSQLRLWDWKTKSLIETLMVCPSPNVQSSWCFCRDIIVHPDGRHVITATNSGHVKIFRLKAN